MVVFGNDVIIMSDKLINYNIEIDEKIGDAANLLI